MNQDTNSKHSVTLFRAFYDAALRRDLKAVADMIDEECEYVLEPDMENCGEKKAVIEVAGRLNKYTNVASLMKSIK